jgi:transcriptional regulator with XRE-family HTH domain
MTGPQLRAIRHLLGYTQAEMALALGFQGKDRSRSTMICQMEAGTKPIQPTTAKLALALQLLNE